MPTHDLTRHLGSWTATDVALATGFVTVLWVDAAQSRSLARQGWRRFRETNPILGDAPTVGQINTYTAVAAAGTLGIAALLPRRARHLWLAGALSVEGATVIYTTMSIRLPFTVR